MGYLWWELRGERGWREKEKQALAGELLSCDLEVAVRQDVSCNYDMLWKYIILPTAWNKSI